MSSGRIHPSAAGATNQPMSNGLPEPDKSMEDPSLPPQRHAGAVGLGPNYPLGVVSLLDSSAVHALRHRDPIDTKGIGDKIVGLKDEIKGKILRKPEIVQHGRELKTGELLRKEREQDNAADPFKQSK